MTVELTMASKQCEFCLGTTLLDGLRGVVRLQRLPFERPDLPRPGLQGRKTLVVPDASFSPDPEAN